MSQVLEEFKQWLLDEINTLNEITDNHYAPEEGWQVFALGEAMEKLNELEVKHAAENKDND